MKLHEFLRKVRDIAPIILFDINGVEILTADVKDYIPTELYDEEIFDIGVGPYTPSYRGAYRSAIYVTLSK